MTVSSLGCSTSAVGTVGIDADTVVISDCSMKIHTVSDNATAGNNDGAIHASMPGGGNNGCTPPYTYDFNGAKTVVTNNPYKWDKAGLAEGFYTLNISDANGLKTNVVFVVASDDNTFISDSALVNPSSDTLTASAVPSCGIQFEDIESIEIEYAWSGNGNDEYIIRWKVNYKTSGSSPDYFDQEYNFVGKKGVVTVITNLFCTSRQTGISIGIDNLDLTTVGIKAVDRSTSKVYPNPFNEEIILVIERTSLIVITDISGKVVYQSTINAGSTSIETDNFSAGIYFITIQDDQTSETKKIIKN